MQCNVFFSTNPRKLVPKWSYLVYLLVIDDITAFVPLNLRVRYNKFFSSNDLIFNSVICSPPENTQLIFGKMNLGYLHLQQHIQLRHRI